MIEVPAYLELVHPSVSGLSNSQVPFSTHLHPALHIPWVLTVVFLVVNK